MQTLGNKPGIRLRPPVRPSPNRVHYDGLNSTESNPVTGADQISTLGNWHEGCFVEAMEIGMKQKGPYGRRNMTRPWPIREQFPVPMPQRE